jgi:hypothetical protein
MATGIGLTVSPLHHNTWVIAVAYFIFKVRRASSINNLRLISIFSQLTPHPPSGALMVTHLDPEGPAAKGGLIAPYDVLYEVDETR